jgi:hypothetical protein
MAPRPDPLAGDPEASFRLKRRRDHLFGMWAATRLGLNGREAEAYARAITIADLNADGEAQVLDKIAADFGRQASAVDEQVLRQQWRRFEELARDQIARENRGAEGSPKQ